MITVNAIYTENGHRYILQCSKKGSRFALEKRGEWMYFDLIECPDIKVGQPVTFKYIKDGDKRKITTSNVISFI